MPVPTRNHEWLALTRESPLLPELLPARGVKTPRAAVAP